jgi:adhesin/invasin
VVAPGAILNAASFQAQKPVAPGSMISVFGERLSDTQNLADSITLPPSLGGTEVLVGERSVPLRFTSSGQLNALIPYDVPVNTEHQLVVRRGSYLSVPEQISVASGQPAVYTKAQSGAGQGVIVNGSTNVLAEPGTPVRAGDVIVIYCAGLGVTDPAVQSGTAATGISRSVNPASVRIGGVNARVEYAGLTPGFPGLYQINAVVPAESPKGSEIPVEIEVSGQTSPPVTIAIQ